MNRPLLRTAAFALLYLVAMYAGRMTVLDGTNLSLVWPAAGVLALWFAGRPRRRSPKRDRWGLVDAAALVAITVAGNMATGVSLRLALCFAVANLVQAYGFAFLIQRWVPGLWRDGVRLTRLAELWRVVGAAALSTLGSALIGPTAVGLESGNYSWLAAAVWMARNTVSVLLIGVALGELLRRRPQRVTLTIEYGVITAVSAVAYVLVFGLLDGLPLAFALITLSVWAGLRLRTTFVALHSLLVGVVAIVYTLLGDGPFAEIGSHALRSLVAQLFVGTVAVVGLALALGRDERTALVDRLRTSERAATEQAMLLTTIIDTMSEGVGVVDDRGRYVLRNPAASRLVGGVTSADGTVRDGRYYGLLHPDGTPVGAHEMPYLLAPADGSVATRDYLVRNAGVPEGRTISLNAGRLPDGRGTVVIFHDVTADRRHRDELRAFAGVVAHDLLNPLTTVEGWAEALREDLEGRPELAHVARIERAAARMHSLINDLLAYTTARDGAVVPIPVDLAGVVADIAAGCTDHAESLGEPAPRITAGELPAVSADPVLVRQLLDNLVGNAIKYTAPGVTPEITIDAGGGCANLGKDEVAGGVGSDGGAAARQVRIAVTDNGIGIPEDQLEAVFDDFHRAHRGRPYAGTGLGLSICRRIVERHGGTIVAEPGPGGVGTRMTFTLPAAAQVPASLVSAR